MDKEFYDKYGKEFDCASCIHLEQCMKQDKPVLITCVNQQYENKIADLEAKLAESESELVLARNTSINTNKMEILHLQIENEELKQQLAEKEKSFDWIYSKWQECVERQTKSKTEFAIQQLQRVKEVCENSKNQVDYEYYTDCWTTAVDKDSLFIEIDQIIKELEGETK